MKYAIIMITILGTLLIIAKYPHVGDFASKVIKIRLSVNINIKSIIIFTVVMKVIDLLIFIILN